MKGESEKLDATPVLMLGLKDLNIIDCASYHTVSMLEPVLGNRTNYSLVYEQCWICSSVSTEKDGSVLCSVPKRPRVLLLGGWEGKYKKAQRLY